MITADHGNAEHMLNDDGSPNTAHTTNPVPLVVTVGGAALADGGILADVIADGAGAARDRAAGGDDGAQPAGWLRSGSQLCGGLLRRGLSAIDPTVLGCACARRGPPFAATRRPGRALAPVRIASGVVRAMKFLSLPLAIGLLAGCGTDHEQAAR